MDRSQDGILETDRNHMKIGSLGAINSMSTHMGKTGGMKSSPSCKKKIRKFMILKKEVMIMYIIIIYVFPDFEGWELVYDMLTTSRKCVLIRGFWVYKCEEKNRSLRADLGSYLGFDVVYYLNTSGKVFFVFFSFLSFVFSHL